MPHRSDNLKTMRRCAGFTMIELAATLVIMSVLVALAVPRYANSLNHYRVDSAARRIAADLALTQNRARMLSDSQSIVFSTSLNRYHIPGYADPDKPTATYTVRLAEAPYFVTLTTASFNGGPSVSFNGYGVPSSAGSVIVSGASSYQKTILINADTGLPRIQ